MMNPRRRARGVLASLLVLSTLLAACGEDRQKNVSPLVSVGTDKTVAEATQVSLFATASDYDGAIEAYAWTQTGGPAVTLVGAASVGANFMAPEVDADTALTFQLTVTDSRDATASDSLTVTVTSDDPPIVSAGGNQTVAESAAVTLGALASDADGSIATYAWTQTGGTAVVLSGASTATPTFTAPALVVESNLVFQVMVTDDDGRSAADSVTVTVQPTLILSGIITDGPIPDATVSVQVGDQTYTATANAFGFYTIVLPATDPAAFVTITATGGAGQENVQLVSIAGSMENLVAAAGADGELDSEDKDVVNVTNVSTAKYVLMVAANDGAPITDDATLDTLERGVDGTELVELSIAIKLVIDSGIALPAGSANTLEMIESFVADETSFDTFLTAVDVADPDLRDETFAAMLADPNLLPAPATVSGSYVLSIVEGYQQSDRGQVVTFNADGTGQLASAVDGLKAFEWSQGRDGTITVLFDTPIVFTSFSSHPTTGFQEQVRVTRTGVTYRQLVDGESTAQWIRTTTASSAFLTGPTVAPVASNAESMVAVTKPAGYLPFATADLPGTWMVPIQGPDTSGIAFSDVQPGFLEFSAGGTGVRTVDGMAFTWSNAGGALSLAFTDGATTVFYGVRRDGIAVDTVAFATLADGSTYAASDLMVEKIAENSSPLPVGRYSLYGFGPQTSFDIVFNANGIAADESYNASGVKTFSLPSSWTLASNGSRGQDYFWDEATSRDVAVCSDPARCHGYRERDWTPVAVDGDRVFVHEVQQRYGYNALAPLHRGVRTFYQATNRFWKLTALPTGGAAKPTRSHHHAERTVTGDVGGISR